MDTKTTQLTEARAETLLYILNHGGHITGFQRLADARDVGHEAARRLCNRLEDDGLVTISSDPNGSHVEFTDAGRKVAIEVGYGDVDVGSGGSLAGERVVRRVHGVTVQARIKNRERIPDEWRRVLARRDDKEWLRLEDYDAMSDTYISARKGWVMRFHKGSVTLQLPAGEHIERFSTAGCFRELSSRVRKGLRWIRQMCGVEVDLSRVEIDRAECAYEEHHLALLVDELPGLELGDIVVNDADGRKVVGMDKSPGVPETETFTGDRAEEIGEVIEDELRQYARRPEAVEWRHSFEREAVLQGVGPVEAVNRLRELDGGDQGRESEEDGGGEPGEACGELYSDEEKKKLDATGYDSMWL